MRELFQAWAAAQVRWVVLRGIDELASSIAEVDLLLAAADVERARLMLAEHGYLRQVAPGRATHRFYHAYVREAGIWLKLDVVTSLDFGRYHEIATPLAAEVLEHAAMIEGMPMPAPADAYRILQIHYLLDRSPGRLRHRERLARWASSTDRRRLASAWPIPEALARRLDEATAQGAWSDLDAMSAELSRSMAAASPGSTRRRLTNRVVRAASRRLPVPGAGGASVALLGPDGSGKSSLAVAIMESLPFPVRLAYMGTYGASFGTVSRLLGASLPSRMMTLWRRWLAGSLHAARGGIALYDRYPSEARIRRNVDRRIRTRLRRWLLARTCPGPDRYLILDAPPSVLYARKPEHDPAWTTANRDAYRRLAAELPRAVVLDASADAATVRRLAIAEIWAALSRRMPRP